MTHTHERCWDWFKQRQICGVSYGAVQISMRILDTGAIKIHGLLLLLLKLTNYIGILLTNKWTVQSIFIFRVSVFSLASIAIFYSGILQGKFEARDKNKPKKILFIRPQPIENLLFMISWSIYLPFFDFPTHFSIDLKIGWISWKKNLQYGQLTWKSSPTYFPSHRKTNSTNIFISLYEQGQRIALDSKIHEWKH